MPHPSVSQLQSFARMKARQVTNKPVVLKVMKNIPNSHLNPQTHRPDTIMRNTCTSKGCEIDIKQGYFKHHSEKALEMGVDHELAHCVVPGSHNAKFKRVAARLGADKMHQKAYWEAQKRNSTGVWRI